MRVCVFVCVCVLKDMTVTLVWNSRGELPFSVKSLQFADLLQFSARHTRTPPSLPALRGGPRSPTHTYRVHGSFLPSRPRSPSRRPHSLILAMVVFSGSTWGRREHRCNTFLMISPSLLVVVLFAPAVRGNVKSRDVATTQSMPLLRPLTHPTLPISATPLMKPSANPPPSTKSLCRSHFTVQRSWVDMCNAL